MKRFGSKGFELSLNMIIIVVIAIIFLGVAIMLIRNWGDWVNDEIPKIIPPSRGLWSPTADDPVFFSPSRVEIKRGESKTVTLQVYNFAFTDITCAIGFTAVGEDDSILLLYSQANREIPVDMIGEWTINVEVPRTSTASAYMYTAAIDCGEFFKQSDLVISVQ